VKYNDGREKLLNVYEKGKRLQWNASERIDWTQDLDPEKPEQLPDEAPTGTSSEIPGRAATRGYLRRAR